jgi:hypothetical protein
MVPHSFVNTRRGSSPSLHRWSAQWEKPPWDAEPGIELRPALQQADAQYHLSYVAPYLSHVAPCSELSRTSCEICQFQKAHRFRIDFTGF